MPSHSAPTLIERYLSCSSLWQFSDIQGSLHLKLEMPIEGDTFQVCC